MEYDTYNDLMELIFIGRPSILTSQWCKCLMGESDVLQ